MNRLELTRPDRRTASLAAAFLAVVGLVYSANADDSLAGRVPAEVGFFAEIHGAGDLLTTLTEPQIWTTLADLAGQPAEPEDVAKWRQLIRQTVKMNPDEAIRVLFARGVAFIGEGPGRAQDAVVVCRPTVDVTTRELLERWEAQRLRRPRRPSTYRLYSNIGVADHEGLFFFGDLLPPDGLLRRVQRFAANRGAQSLGDDPAYKSLLARLPKDPDGVLFARLGDTASSAVPSAPSGSQPTARPTSRPMLESFRGPLRDAENVMLALHRDGSLLHFTAVADAKEGRGVRPTGSVQLVRTLPERALFAWEGLVNFSELGDALAHLPEENPVRRVFKLQDQLDVLDEFLGSLDTDACFAVGPVFPARRSPGAPPLPAGALLLSTGDAAVASSELRTIVELCVKGYAVFAMTHGLPALPLIRETPLGETTAFVVDLSLLLKPTARAAIGEIHFCWVVHDDVLIIASHFDWLRRIVAARAGQAPNLSKTMQLPRGKLSPGCASAIVVQSGPISDIGVLWVDYLKNAKPEVFDESWWRSRQPGGGEVRLGIDVTPDVPNRRLRIDAVHEGQTSRGRLDVGDFIVGCGNLRFATDDPISEIRTAIRERPHARWLDLLVERKGVTWQVRLPLPFIDPIKALERLTAIGRIAQRAVYLDDQSDPAGPRGFLTIELRTTPQPLFEFSEPISIGSSDGPPR